MTRERLQSNDAAQLSVNAHRDTGAQTRFIHRVFRCHPDRGEQ
jgi:hypothetical protein